MRLCEIEGCGQKHWCKGKCKPHFDHWRYYLDLEASRAKGREQYLKFKPRYTAKNKEFRENPANREYIREKQLAWTKENLEYDRQRAREYRLADPDAARQRFSEWARNNPEKSRVRAHRRRAIMRGCEGSFTFEEWQDRCADYGEVCPRCKQTCAKFTVDHIVPVSKGGSNWIWNIQPLCYNCNSSKRDAVIYYPAPVYSL